MITQVNEYLQSLPKEASLRPPEEDSDEDSESGAGYSDREQQFGPEDVEAEEEGGKDGNSVARGERREESKGHPSSDRLPPGFYPAGLAQLRTELERKYMVDNIGSISLITVDGNMRKT